jgi:hypothetical protein
MKEYAIVTFVVGENYTDIFNIVKSSWQNYANKCEADLIVMDDYIDYNSLNGRSPIWQKLLLINSPHLKKYKKVCYLDSDIYINSKSPSVFEVNVFNKVGVVRHESLFYPQSHVIQYERWIKLMDVTKKDQFIADRIRNVFKNYYANYDLRLHTNLKFNAGVLLLDPNLHGELFNKIYNKYAKDAFDQDQTAVNYELIKNNLYHEIDLRYNAQLGGILSHSYPFLHFMDDKGIDYLNNSTYCNLAMMCLANIIEINYFIHFAGLRWPLLILEQLPDDYFDNEIDYHFFLKKLINTNIRK